jgi:hypothetical protein
LNTFLYTPKRPETPIAESTTAVSVSPPMGLETAPVVDSVTVVSMPSPAFPPGSRLMLSEEHRAVLRELQDSLRQNGIDAEVEEIGHGILDALVARPSLCRGLLAAFFLDV